GPLEHRHVLGHGGHGIRRTDRLLTTRQLRRYHRSMELPKIVSVDDHVVEPAHVWTDRLPAKYRDIGPRVVRAPLGEMTFVGGKFSFAPGDDGPMCDWWFYEDLRWPQTRLPPSAPR